MERESDGAEDNIHGNKEPGEREQDEEVPEPILRRSTRPRTVCKQNTMGTQ